MSKIIFEFEPEPNSWKVTISNQGCSPAQLHIAAQMVNRISRVPDGNSIVADYPDDGSLDGLITASNSITNHQFGVFYKWCEIMAERGFAIMLMESEARAANKAAMIARADAGNDEDLMELIDRQRAEQDEINERKSVEFN